MTVVMTDMTVCAMYSMFFIFLAFYRLQFKYYIIVFFIRAAAGSVSSFVVVGNPVAAVGGAYAIVILLPLWRYCCFF